MSGREKNWLAKVMLNKFVRFLRYSARKKNGNP